MLCCEGKLVLKNDCSWQCLPRLCSQLLLVPARGPAGHQLAPGKGDVALSPLQMGTFWGENWRAKGWISVCAAKSYGPGP